MAYERSLAAHDLLSTTKRLGRDVQFAVNLGRDSAFDPFSARDMTKLFSAKKGFSLMYCATQPLREPPTLVNMFKMPDPKRDYVVPPSTHAMYDYQLPPNTKDVKFPQNKRFGDIDCRHSSLARPVVYEPSKSVCKRAQSVESRSRARTPQAAQRKSVDSWWNGDSPKLPRCSQSPNLGRQTGRDNLSHDTQKKVQQTRMEMSEEMTATSDASRPKTTQRKYTTFPFEMQGASRVGSAGDGKDRPTSGRSHSDKPHDATSSHQAGKPPTHPTPQPATAGEEEDEWQKKHKVLLTRWGLTGGGKKERRRKSRPPGADFGVTSRKAPTNHLHPEKQINDLTYTPKYEVTTHARSTPRVSLSAQSSRSSNQPDLTVNMHAIMNEYGKRQEKKSNRRQSMAPHLPTGYTGVVPLLSDEVEHVPTTFKDDYTCHPDTQRVPTLTRTREFKGSPDIYMGSNRPDETIDSLLGGSKSTYVRRVRQEMQKSAQKQQQASATANSD